MGFLVAGCHVCGVCGGVLAALNAQQACPVTRLACVEVEQAQATVFAAGLVVGAGNHDTITFIRCAEDP